jgi:hypothetical protein
MHNVNTFSYSRILKRKDKRRAEYRQQRKERGFDNSELWSLDHTIIRFTLPRLKIFRNYTQGYPPNFNSFEEWQVTIDKMIDGMEKYILDTSDEEAVEGIDLFLKYFRHLWS